MIYDQRKDCGFSKKDLERDGYYKFLPLPRGAEIEKIPVTVVLVPNTHYKNKNCRRGKKFHISIIKTPELKLGFTRIDSRQRCSTDYSLSSQTKVRGFVDSDEVKKYIPAMFPVPGISAESLPTANNNNPILGSCDDTLVDPNNKKSTITLGMLKDISTLEEKRALLGYSKIFAIVPRDYFKFHNEPSTTRGLFLHFLFLFNLTSYSWGVKYPREECNLLLLYTSSIK